MIFGKIDYLNLLPFHVFLKRSRLSSQDKKIIEFKKGVPSKLNRDLRCRRIDAAVISSIESGKKRYKKVSLGIVAKGDVKSVLVRKGTSARPDPASASSNALAEVLGLEGEVLIGDRALKAYLREGEEAFYDLGRAWRDRTGLPFVFGRFSCVKGRGAYERLAREFLRANVKIPNYILAKYAQTRGISADDIKWYLKFISYEIGAKEQKALRIFFKEVRKNGRTAKLLARGER